MTATVELPIMWAAAVDAFVVLAPVWGVERAVDALAGASKVGVRQAAERTVALHATFRAMAA